MYTDPIIPIFVVTIFIIILITLILRKFKQPHVITYLLAGILLGPNMLGVIEDQQTLSRLGSIGVIFLLFFVGMEISPRRLIRHWPAAIIGTFLQIAISVFLVFLLGVYLEWSFNRIIMLGFVISLSSTTVVLKLLDDWNETNTQVGQDVLGILLIQDILVVPMLIYLNFVGGAAHITQYVILQIIGGVIVVSLVAWIITRDQINIPWLKYLKEDHELQLFTSLGICFGMAMFTGLVGLSSALGAFVGGMIVGSARETHWIELKLLSFRTLFIAVFFVSIGMLIDINFISERIWLIAILVIFALLTNTLVNALILKFSGEPWKTSLYGGSLLSQIGEFSFVIISVGYNANIISYRPYEITISVIALTLFVSPFWILFIRRICGINEKKLKRIDTK